MATIIPLASAGQEAAARTFNAAVPGIVQSKVNGGKRVHLVDMHAALTTADLIDGVHPTAGGYDKMAATWYSALRSVPGSIGDPGTPARRSAGRRRLRPLPGRAGQQHRQRHPADHLGLQRRRQPALDRRPARPCSRWASASTHRPAPPPGPKVQLWDCSGATNQRWNLNANGTISNAQSGLCLDVNGNATANGSPVILWTCTTATNQLWTRR